MATDVEESDTDENERSVFPPKRRRTGLVGGPCRSCDPPPETEPEEARADEAERLAGEKLRVWQNCQVAKGFLDNAVNRIVEDSILNPCWTASLASRAAWQFGGSRVRDDDDDTERTAVSAAISDRGLVRAASFDFVRDSWRSEPSPPPPPPVLRSPSLSSPPAVIPITVPWMDDPTDESDREQDFLERAVAEAIKKKGLSALSVDYG